jgi:YbbR domain-containing protein
VKRVVALVVHNWPLKLAAIGLATLLYAGLVLSQSAQRTDVRVSIVPRNQPADAYLVDVQPKEVTEIRYFAPPEVGRVSSSSFSAFVDLAAVDPAGGKTLVAVQVEATDARIRIIDFQPTSVLVELDPLTSKVVPVEVDHGEVPPGLEVGEPQLSSTDATVSGPASVLDRVTAALARVTIEPSGLDVDRDVQLVPVDALGEVVTPVDVNPESVHVKIRVGSDAETRTLPVDPIIIGTPANGFQVASVTVEPTVVTIQGDADALAALDKVDTDPISVAGARTDLAETATLSLPSGVDPLGTGEVQVTVVIRAISGSRTFSAGILLSGARDDRTYALSTDRVSVVIGGRVSQLDRLDPTSFSATVDVAALAPGSHSVTVVVANLAAGLTVISIDPPSVTVEVGLPATPTPRSPSPSPAASASPASVP